MKARLLRLGLLLSLILTGTLAAPHTALADTLSSSTINLCDVLSLSPCPAGASSMPIRKTAAVNITPNCTEQYGEIYPSIYTYYDPSLGASYNVQYAGVAIEVFCSQPETIAVAGIAQPNDTTTSGSKTHPSALCQAATYCTVSAVWGHNVILDSVIADYETVDAQIGAGGHTKPYFPDYTTAGTHVW